MIQCIHHIDDTQCIYYSVWNTIHGMQWIVYNIYDTWYKEGYSFSPVWPFQGLISSLTRTRKVWLKRVLQVLPRFRHISAKLDAGLYNYLLIGSKQDGKMFCNNLIHQVGGQLWPTAESFVDKKVSGVLGSTVKSMSRLAKIP